MIRIVSFEIEHSVYPPFKPEAWLSEQQQAIGGRLVCWNMVWPKDVEREWGMSYEDGFIEATFDTGYAAIEAYRDQEQG